MTAYMTARTKDVKKIEHVLFLIKHSFAAIREVTYRSVIKARKFDSAKFL
jgi:hypothetical protein